MKKKIKEFAEEHKEHVGSIYFAFLHNYLQSVQNNALADSIVKLFESGSFSHDTRQLPGFEGQHLHILGII